MEGFEGVLFFWFGVGVAFVGGGGVGWLVDGDRREVVDDGALRDFWRGVTFVGGDVMFFGCRVEVGGDALVSDKLQYADESLLGVGTPERNGVSRSVRYVARNPFSGALFLFFADGVAETLRTNFFFSATAEPFGVLGSLISLSIIAANSPTVFLADALCLSLSSSTALSTHSISTSRHVLGRKARSLGTKCVAFVSKNKR